MIKYAPAVLVGFFTDAFQFLMGLALVSLPFVGATAGAIGGAALCSSYLPNWQWVQLGCASVGGFVGLKTGVVATPIGIVLAPVVVFCIGVLGGTMLIAFLIFSGAFDGKIVLLGLTGEVLPFFGLLPFWTGVAVACAMSANKKAKEKMRLAEQEQAGSEESAPTQPYSRRPTGASIPARAPSVPRADNDNERAQETPRGKMELKSPDIRRPQKAAVAAALALLFIVPGAHTAVAQVAPEPVRFTIAPETPGPNELVIIEAEGIGTTLGDSTITWRLGGKTILSGIGERKFSFTTGALGSQQRVSVVVSRSGQSIITREFVFAPSLVHLLWEADTTTPFFYRGAALYSAGSSVKIVAFPNVVIGGTEVGASALSYQWSRGGEPVPAQSGTGRSTFTFEGNFLNLEEVVSLDVLLSGVKVGHAEVSIPASDPLLVLYHRDPLRGILYESALPATINLIGRELSVRAEPYYFSNSSLANGNLVYSWLLDGEETASADSRYGFLTLRQTGGSTGGAELAVELQNNDSSKLGQSAAATLQIIFGAQSNTGAPSLAAAVFNSFRSIAQTPSGAQPGVLTYTPLEPIPGFTGVQSCPNISVFLSNLLKILITVGAIFAVLSLTVGGIMYMVSDVVDVKSKAKERIWAAVWGIILICAAWLILYTINPQLVSFSSLFPSSPCGPTGAYGTTATEGTAPTSSGARQLTPEEVAAIKQLYKGALGEPLLYGSLVYSGDIKSPEFEKALQTFEDGCKNVTLLGKVGLQTTRVVSVTTQGLLTQDANATNENIYACISAQ